MAAPLRILLLYDCLYPETIGGVEHRNAQLASALASRGHEVTLTGFSNRAPSRVAGVTTLPLGARRAGRRGAAQALRYAGRAARLDLQPWDVVETANIPLAHVLPLWQRCRLAGKPLVVTWHECWGPYWRRHLQSPLWPLFAALEALGTRAGTAVAVSRHTAERVSARRRGPVEVLPNGVPLAEVRAAAAAAVPGPPLISAGRLLREKGLRLLLEAVARVQVSHPGPLLSILGEGPERDALLERARQPDLVDRVRFVGRLETSAEVWRELGGARVAVSASEREGFGLFPLEAMAAGLPVVACHAPDSAVSELVRDGIDGLFTDPDPHALASGLQRLLEGEPLRRRLAASAARRAAEYDWDVLGARAEQLFYRVCRAAGSGTAKISAKESW